MTRLTPRQLQILCLIRGGVISRYGLNRASGYCLTNGHTSLLLRELKQAGLVTWSPDKSRTLRLTESGRRAVAGYVLGPGGAVGKWEAVESKEVDKMGENRGVNVC